MTAMTFDGQSLMPTQEDLAELFDQKYPAGRVLGWGPPMRRSFGYFTPDDHYEALVARLVQPGAAWADVGCGRNIFPSNPSLAKTLAARAGYVYGIDPDPNIRDNPFITEGFEGMIEDCDTKRRFDLVTLRMVAEHIVHPQRSVSKIASLLEPGGRVVIYTPNKWAPVSMLAAVVPNRLHYPVKRAFWGGEERDTFPTAFKLNTRADLARHCSSNGLEEQFFAYLDDCRTFGNFRWLNYAELTLQRLTRALSIRYPENCLLGVYRKAP